MRSMVRIGLISCVKLKQNSAAKAKDMYTSTLFKGMRYYIEHETERWYILSAKYGLLDPERTIEPYNKTLLDMNGFERLSWARTVLDVLKKELPPPNGSELVILAGEKYRENLIPQLKALGYSIVIPMEGLSQGRQLQFLNNYREGLVNADPEAKNVEVEHEMQKESPPPQLNPPERSLNENIILEFLQKYRQGHCDDCLSAILNITPRQQVNGIARLLESKKELYRRKSDCFKCHRHKICNHINGS